MIDRRLQYDQKPHGQATQLALEPKSVSKDHKATWWLQVADTLIARHIQMQAQFKTRPKAKQHTYKSNSRYCKTNDLKEKPPKFISHYNLYTNNIPSPRPKPQPPYKVI